MIQQMRKKQKKQRRVQEESEVETMTSEDDYFNDDCEKSGMGVIEWIFVFAIIVGLIVIIKCSV